jgi:thioredoxin 1
MIEPTRDEVDGMAGPVVLEFGARWCPYCQAIQSHMAGILAKHPQVQHLPIEDGQGKPLGRSFRVTLWPTLVFMRDGIVVYQSVRPSPSEIDEGIQRVTECEGRDQ